MNTTTGKNPDRDANPGLIQAAGGLLWREIKGSQEILVVHRKRYDDWVLPKGKVKNGEHLEETALREVAEEGGYRAKLLDFAGDTFYYDKGCPKIVLYWNMEVEAEIPQEKRQTDSPDEGDKVKWLSVPDAMKLISYEDERQLLRHDTKNGVSTLLPAFRTDAPVLPSNWYSRLFGDPSAERLRVSLVLYYHEMGHLEALVRDAGLHHLNNYFRVSARLLGESTNGLTKGDVEYGWGAFNAAQRIETMIYSKMMSDRRNRDIQTYAAGMFNGRAESLIVESQGKLSGWRLVRLHKLLCNDKKNLKDNVQVGDVLLAQRIMSEHFENSYLRLKIITKQIRFLELIAAVDLVLWLVLLFRTSMFEIKSTPTTLSLSILALIFGILGACISGILRLERRSVHNRIPNQLESRVFMLARPLIGAVSALGVVVFVLAGIVDFGEASLGLYMAASFAAGFSERLLQFGVDQVGGGESSERKQ